MNDREPILIECAEPKRQQLLEAKAYASIADNGRDAQFLDCLRRAMREVQAYADTSLLDATLELTCEGRDADGGVRLYQSVDEIVSVKDGQGNPVEYERRGRRIYPELYSGEVVVRYTTKVIPAQAQRYKTTYEQVATALFDGNTEEEQAILRTI